MVERRNHTRDTGVCVHNIITKKKNWISDQLELRPALNQQAFADMSRLFGFEVLAVLLTVLSGK